MLDNLNVTDVSKSQVDFARNEMQPWLIEYTVLLKYSFTWT